MEIIKFYEQALTELKSALNICKDSSVAVKSLTLIMSGSGTVYKGCNWKRINDSYALEDTCSEYEAVVNLLLSGENRILSVITISAENNAVVVPCEKCRQLIISLNPHNNNCQIVTGKNSQAIITSLSGGAIINENGGFSGFDETTDTKTEQPQPANNSEESNKKPADNTTENKVDDAQQNVQQSDSQAQPADSESSSVQPENNPAQDKDNAEENKSDTPEIKMIENDSAEENNDVNKSADQADKSAQSNENPAPNIANDIQLKIVEFDENKQTPEEEHDIHTSFTDSDAFNNLKLMYDNIDSENEFIDKDDVVMPNSRPFNVSSLQHDQTAPPQDVNQQPQQQYTPLYNNGYPNPGQPVTPNMNNTYTQQPNQMYNQPYYNNQQQNMYANQYNQQMYNGQPQGLYQQQGQMYNQQQANQMYNQQPVNQNIYNGQNSMYQNPQMNNQYNNNPYYAAQPVNNNMFMNQNSGYLNQVPNQNNTNSVYTTPNVQQQPTPDQAVNSQYLQHMQAPVSGIQRPAEEISKNVSQSVYSSGMAANDNNAIFKNRLNNILSGTPSASPITNTTANDDNDEQLKENLLQSAKDKKKAAKIDQKFLKKAKRKGNI